MKAAVLLLVLAASMLLPSCADPTKRREAPSQSGGAELVVPEPAFSGTRAWSGLRSLSAPGEIPARARLEESLARLGFSVEERVTRLRGESGEELELVHLEILLPGASSDRFVLIAPYGGPGFENVSPSEKGQAFSGAALLLELSRALSEQQRPYSIQVLFLDEGGSDLTGENRAGSRLLAASMAERDELEGVRLLVVFDRVCGAELQIARDLRSQRHHREHFWKIASELGYTEAFSTERGFESVEASHRAFADQGLRPVVAITDSTYGESESTDASSVVRPDAVAGCLPESLDAVGDVSLMSLMRIGERLVRIDRFSAQPLVPRESASPSVPPVAQSDSGAPR
ncbi:MAG: hypothetical protein AAEJ53_14690 [Myxococcota bacterium]